MNYTEILDKMQISLLEPLKQVKRFHKMKCLVCDHEWSATPISKVHNFRKNGYRGCPECYSTTRSKEERQAFIQKIKDKGFTILSEYDGNQRFGVKVTVRNNSCGHEFNTDPRNLGNKQVNCPRCNKSEKIKRLNANSKERSVEWQKTADIWDRYRHRVYMATRSAYHKHKTEINPTNLPRGLAGEEGAYHLDHIVPVRWCFEHYVPVELCAHPSNLRMVSWLENLGTKDKLKEGIKVPEIFAPYIPPNK